MDFLERGRGRLFDDRSKNVKIKRQATKFVVFKGVLYRQSLDGILFWYIANHEMHEAMSEVHSNIYRAYK